MQWKRVLNAILRLFGNTNIQTNIFMQEVELNSSFDNALVADFSNDDEKLQRFFHMTAVKLALEGTLQKSPTDDRNEPS